MSTVSTTVSVSGMTCGHCVSSVSEELEALAGVEQVDVDLNAGGVSTVTITSIGALSPAEIGEAVAEAGYLVVANEPEHPAQPHRARHRTRKTVSNEQLLDRTGSRVIELDIEGMTCASCVNRVERKLGKLDGVEATVNLPLESAHVTVPARHHRRANHRHGRGRRLQGDHPGPTRPARGPRRARAAPVDTNLQAPRRNHLAHGGTAPTLRPRAASLPPS